MGKKEDKKRLQKVLGLLMFTKEHLHCRACEFDDFVDLHSLPFHGIETVSNNYVTYLSNDGNNFRIKITKTSNNPELM